MSAAATAPSAATATERRERWLVLVIALGARLAVVAWAWRRFPPADDGSFYQTVATRIARGEGYTWLWPDGAVTYAAHYPVGYPALLGGVYALLGPNPGFAMLLNAVLGTLGVWGVHRLAAASAPRVPALLAALVAALHPSLVGYTPALMTEGVSAALLAFAGGLCLVVRERRPRFGFVLLGAVLGALVLIRPQLLVLAPVFGALAGAAGTRWKSALAVSAVALACCAPWTARNCLRMDRCVFVSANGGWNLYIGSADKATGSWVALEELGVPPECRTVFAEVGKDVCFGRAGLRNVLGRPLHFLSLVPKKLDVTFDWSGAPGHYLHTSNWRAFDEEQKLTLGKAELLVERLVVLAALIGVGRMAGPRRRARLAVAALGMPWLFVREAWVAHVLLVLGVALFGWQLFRRPSALLAGAVVAATALTHAVFFGAGRYGLVCVPLLCALAATAGVPRKTTLVGRTALRF